MELTYLIFLGFPFVFAGMWCLVCAVISIVGGWWKLSQRYPAIGRAEGRKYPVSSAMLGKVGYNNCLTFYASARGLRMEVWPIFRIKHPPIFLPWEVIRNPEVKRFLWVKRVRVDVGDPVLMRVTLPEAIFRSFEEFAGGSGGN